MEASVSCMVRKAEEETGLALTEDDLSLVHIIDLLDTGSTSHQVLLRPLPLGGGEASVGEPERCTE